MSEQGKDADELDALRERVAELEGRLAERRRYGLVWEEPTGEEDDPYETEIVRDRTERELPLISEEPSMAVNEGLDPHLLIEGDNYFTLSGLTFTHQHAIDLIYIDPPYNTGKKDDFRYNDKFVAEDDDFRHSKWLSFMAPRLELAKELLGDDGVILISIDDNEFATLKLLCDEIFSPGNFIGTFIWNGGRKNDAKYISTGHDYVLAYSRDAAHLLSEDRRWRVKKTGLNEIYKKLASLRKKHGTDFSGIETEIKTWYSGLAGDHPSRAHAHYWRVDERGVFYTDNLSSPNPRPNLTYEWKGYQPPAYGWRYDKTSMKRLDDDGRIWYPDSKTKRLQLKRYLHESETEVPASVFYKDRRAAAKALTALMGSKVFKFPKDPEVLKRLFRATLGDKRRAIILDFFAGSGSTGQAVLEMNVEDGTNHQFILGTNNENGISREVAHERLRRLMTGKCADGKPRPDGGEALGGSLRFFVSDKEFITRSSTPDETREAFRTACRDLIRIKEDCFEPVKKTKNYEIFKGLSDQGEIELLGILYGLDGRESLIKALTAESDESQVTVYAFSLHSQANPKPFTEAFGSRLVLGSIPEQLLRTYERVFERRLYGGWNT